MKKLLFIALTLLSINGFAQNQGKIWYFGSYAGLDFSTTPPTELTNGQINTSEGCATLSDDNGDLLLYTDGISVWNSSHSIMDNGTGLGGDPSSSQSGIIVPKPGSTTNFYIVSVSAYSNSNVFVSEVDISYNDGQGQVLTDAKKIPLLSGTSEFIQATPVSNGTDWWVVTNKKNTNSYYAYKIDSDGIDIDNPVISSVGNTIQAQGELGYLKFNSANNKMAVASYFKNHFQVFNWNASTGKVGTRILNYSPGGTYSGYGAEFSPNNRYAYFSDGSGIKQFDLQADDVLASMVQIASGSSNWGMQSAPDGKIYVAMNANSLSVIANPNEAGTASNYSRNSFTLSRNSRLGLPNIIASFVSTGPPVLKNLTATSVESTSATLSATVTSDGGETVTERGFYYGTTANPTSNKTTVSGTTGDFSLNITGLSAGTKYYYKAYATNSNGTTTTSDGTFTTTEAAGPTITSFTPTAAGIGQEVVITGTGYTGTTSVTVGGVDASSFTIDSDTQITAVVADGASSGDIEVINSSTASKTGFKYKVVEYLFEGNVLDQTDADLDGSIYGDVTYGIGASGQSVCFDRGSENWIVMPNNLIRNLSEFTISLRFKTTSKGVMLGYQNREANGSANEFIPILTVQSDGKLRSTLWTTASRDMSVVSTDVVNDNNWHKVDMSITPSSIHVYIDGELAGSTTSGTVAHLSMSYNQIGFGRTDSSRDSAGGDLSGWEGFTGCIDNFMILDEGITQEEIEEVTELPAPTMTSFSPSSAETGQEVTISGTNLNTTTSVSFGGTSASSFTVVNATTVKAKVAGGATGAVELVADSGTVSKTGFIYNTSSQKTFFENTVNVTPQLLFPTYTHSSSSSSFNGQSLSLSYSSGGGVEDVLYIREEGTGDGELNILNASTKEVRIGATTIGTFASSLGGSGVNGETLSISWNSNATLSYINKVINALTYKNSSNTPTNSRDISMLIGDPAGNVTEVITVLVQAENDKHIIGSTNLEVRDITTPGDPVDKMFGSSPGSEQVPNAIDNNTNTKYLNFAQAGSGFIVTPSLGATKVNQFTFTSANDASGRDPMTFSLYGSNDDGNSFTPIVTNANTNLTTARFTESESEEFENTKGYAMYKLIFPTVRSTSANSMQIGEVEFLGIPFQETVFAIGSDPVKVHPKLPIYDAEDDQIASAKVTIGTSLDPNDVLSWTAASGITGTYDSSTGVLSFSGTASIDTYKTLLRSVTFTTSSNSNGKVREVSFTVTDTDGNQSDATKAKIIVSFQPELTGLDHYGSGFNLVENDITYAGVVSNTTGLDDNDEEDLPLSFIITSVGTNGSMTKNGSAAGEGTIISKGDTIKWTPDSTGTGITVFGLKAFDGDLASDTEYDLTMDVESLPLPTITSFTPNTIGADGTVTVTGTNFNSASSVKIGSTTVSYTVVNQTTITLTVNSNVTSGKIYVTTIAGTATSSDSFTILDEEAPVISAQSFSYQENQSSGYLIGTVVASDNLGVDTFSISSGNDSGFYTIDSSGKLTLTSTGAGEVDSNDYESGTNTFTLTIEASDASSNSSSTTVTLLVTNDVNDDTDTDEDGIPDVLDTDDDGDGVLDTEDRFPLDPNESKDTDGDGIGDNSDDDIDGDGIPNESDVDQDGDGVNDNGTDFDNDGINDANDTDDDGDGVLDINDAFPLNANESVDTDGDGIGNNADLDDDGDGLLDTEEDELGTNSLSNDSDSDGVIDGTEVEDKTNPLDACSLVVDHQTESTTVWDAMDCDDDGLLNVQELFVAAASSSRADNLVTNDSDGDGIPNYLDADDDGDGVNTILELEDITMNTLDSDGDGIPNHLDVDDDGDGITTLEEYAYGSTSDIADSDGDGIPNYLDPDDDNDGVLTGLEVSLTSENALEYDSDGDGIPNYVDPVDNYSDAIKNINVSDQNFEALDTDGDGIPNLTDVDDDGDGFSDQEELACDTNPLRIESQPGDYDGDGIPDCLDDDIDGDGVNNVNDLFPTNPYESADSDGDGIGDNLDADDDNDGVIDTADAFPYDSSEWKDTDSDGIGDNADTDFFNDGFDDSFSGISGFLSPNTTTLESKWIIANINLHPYNVVSVFDKDGKRVFHTQNYKNDWDGTYKDTGKKLPSGTYYYKVHFYDTNETFTGWMFIAY